MGYPVGYTIPSGMILGYNIGRRDPKPISFKRYGTKFKTGYPTGRWDISVADKITDSLERG